MGNKLGWIIAGLLVALLVVYLLLTVVFPSPDDPTADTKQPGILDLLAPRTPVAEAMGEEPIRDADAGDDYAAAVAFYRKHAADFEAMHALLENDENALLDISRMELCRTILKTLAPAAKKRTMTYTFVHTPTALKVSAFPDGAKDFEHLADVLECLIEHYRRTKQLGQAIEPARVLFWMGWHLMNERARFFLVASGMEYQNAAGETLLEAYKNAGDAKKLEAMENYLSELRTAHQLTMAKQKIVWNYNAHAGDVFHIVENDKDRAWRVEGTLALGVLKFRQKGHRGNLRKIDQLLEAARTDPEELIRAAAEVARSCTAEEITRWQQ